MAAFDSSLNDPYISSLLSPSSSVHRTAGSHLYMPNMSSLPAASGTVPNLIQFLESVPPPVTLLLVELAPTISRLRWAAEVVSWKSHWTDPWLALAGWWAVCLSANGVFRYFLPLALLLPSLLSYLQPRRATLETSPRTEHSISLSLSDLTTLQTLLPTLPALPSLTFTTALRLSAFIYLPYIILTSFVPMAILLGLVGTLLLTYRAPWARTIRSVLWRSAYVRRFLLRVWSLLSGSVLPSFASISAQASLDPASKCEGPSASAPTSPPIRFLFTILECQRWWMGLDWTAALLPGERPSWCGVSQQPVPPPSAFSLPPPTSVYLAAPNGKRVRRIATWRWEEGEWGVLVNKEGTGAKRVEKKPPGVEDEEGGARIATKAASMLKERKASMSTSAEATPGKEERDPSAGANVGHGVEPDRGENLATDVDGWVYGDNKWEAASAKGGMGKYTRYRRWTRIAVLEETVEEVGPGVLGVVKEEEGHSPTAKENGQEPINVPKDAVNGDARNEAESPRGEQDPRGEGGNGQEGGLGIRQRLKTAAKGARNVS